jgi:hypothetical protein
LKIIISILRIRPHLSAAEVAQEWLRKVQNTNNYLQTISSDRYLIIRYEDLVTKTEQTLEKICNLLGIDFSSQMLPYWKAEHHLLAGNSGTRALIWKYRNEEVIKVVQEKQGQYYEELGLRLKLDLRWQQELSSDDLEQFTRVVGEFNQPYEFNFDARH